MEELKPESKRRGRPPRDKNILNTILQDEEESCPAVKTATIGDVPQDNEGLKPVYDAMHTQGPTAWFGDGVEERALILRIGQPWVRKEVLEIGCGEGELAALIKEEDADVLAIDYSEEAIRNLEKNCPNIPHLRSTYQAIGKRYNRVVMQGVLEHLDNPFTELKWMMDTLVTDYGDIITSSPGFINPRGIVWMTLDMLGAVMSKTDLHFINPWDMEEFAKQNGYRVAMQCCDLDWAGGERMMADLKQRIPLALELVGYQDDKFEKFMCWLKLATDRMQPATMGGATIVYKIMKG